MSSSPHRADKDVLVQEVVGEADAVPEDCTLRERARRVNRDHPDLFLLRAVELYEPGDDAALADAGRAGEAHGDGLAGVRVELGDYPPGIRVLALDLGDDPGQRPSIAGEQPLDEPIIRHRAPLPGP